jgi:endoglucanase
VRHRSAWLGFIVSVRRLVGWAVCFWLGAAGSGAVSRAADQPDQLLYDTAPAEPERFYQVPPAHAQVSVVEVSGQAFTRAARVTVTPGTRFWEVGGVFPTRSPVRRGDALRLSVWLRNPGPQPVARLRLKFQDAERSDQAAYYHESGALEVAGEHWQRVEFRFVSRIALAAGTGEAVLFLGDQAQTVEVAQLRLELDSGLEDAGRLGEMLWESAGPGDSAERVSDSGLGAYLRVRSGTQGPAWEPQLRLPWTEEVRSGDLLQIRVRLRASPAMGNQTARVRVGWQRDGSADGIYDPTVVQDFEVGGDWELRSLSFPSPMAFNAGVGPAAQVVLHFGLQVQTVDLGFLEVVNLGQEPPDTPPHRLLASMRRGINLGNYLEYAECPAVDRYNPSDFAAIRAEGFDHVRLPVAWHQGNGPAPEHSIAGCRWQRADSVVTGALAAGLGVVLDLHHFDELKADPVGQRARFVALWRQVAGHYAHAPSNVVFELLNEPFQWAGTDTDLNAAYTSAISAIRAAGGNNKDRLVLLMPAEPRRSEHAPYLAHWRRLHTLGFPDDDPWVAATVHNYDPYLFTHQGTQITVVDGQTQGWTLPEETSTVGVRFPGPPMSPLLPDARVTAAWALDWFAGYNDPTRQGEANPSSAQPIREFTETVLSWSMTHQRAVYVGEFGAYLAADPDSRVAYAGGARQLLEDSGLSWAWWNWDSDFAYIRTGNGYRQPRPPQLRAALLPESPLGPGVAPAIFKEPQPVVGNPGARITLSVEADGTAPLRYQWHHDGAPLADADGPVLILSELTAQHMGEYGVTVTNGSGIATSARVRVDLLPASDPPMLEVDPTEAGSLRIRLIGKPHTVYELQTSTNLLDWDRVWRGSDPSGVSEYLEPATRATPHRWFRGRIP